MTTTAKPLARLRNFAARFMPAKMLLHPHIALFVLVGLLTGIALYRYAPAGLGTLWFIGTAWITLLCMVARWRLSKTGELDLSEWVEESDAFNDAPALLDDAGSSLGYPIILERRFSAPTRRLSPLYGSPRQRTPRAHPLRRRRSIPPHYPEAK